MVHGGARPCPGAAGPALVVAFTSKHLHVMEKTKRELRKEEGNGAMLATVRSPARPWRDGARNGHSDLTQAPMARLSGGEGREEHSGATVKT